MKGLFLPLLLAASSVWAAPLDVAEQQRIAFKAADLIERRYAIPENGARIAIALRAERWDRPLAPKAFAELLTKRLRAIAQDGHLAVDYSQASLGGDVGEAEFSRAELDRFYGPRLNHGVEKIERLEGNIMLLDLRVFPPPEMAGDVIAAAMTLVAQGDALIIDLRSNGGGMETANLLMSYLLPPGSEISGTYDRPSNKHVHAATAAWVPGRRFGAEKPLYILTSKRTFSAAEAVAYDLKHAKRATIVGEVTGGGANPFEYRRINDHFALSLPEARSISPVTGSNWQNIGVDPDVAVPADRALETALMLARAKLKKD